MNNKKRDCFASLAMTGQKAFAFTLSEVLIVLAVLGVVAAITIPDLIQDYREKALITALKKSYTEFSQAVDMATIENGPLNTWDIGENTQAGSQKLYDILKPYLRMEKECGTSKGCFADHYEALFNKEYAWANGMYGWYAAGVLANGASFYTISNGTGCPSNSCGSIRVDLNGASGPNKVGVDTFAFYITTNGLYPIGWKGTGQCEYNNTNAANGGGCTYWALKHENMDYLRKAGDYYGH